MKILFVQAGGTIDKSYAEFARSKTYAFDINKPAFKSLLSDISKTGINFEYRTESVLKKDSLDMTMQDRVKLIKACLKAAENKVIITHGTDNMIQTAEVLNGIKDKVIILTGSTFPEKQKNSEAWFNIGMAVGAINLLSDGVYIAMSGRIYEWDKVQKNQDTGIFEDK